MSQQQNLAEQIRQILGEKFIYVDAMSEVLTLAIGGKKNVIIYGPGGHGKSEMVQAVIDGLGLVKETFPQFFGEGMTEERLFGGMDFEKFNEKNLLEYKPQSSFLNSRIAVFEELFDAPPVVLLALKDVLTARVMRNGVQQYPMRTETIICLTNKQPGEISELGDSAHALVERFPIQLELKWESYKKEDYLRLFAKIETQLEPGPDVTSAKSILAEMLAKAVESGIVVSPRTARQALEICRTWASIRGAKSVEKEDLARLRYVAGLETLGKTIEKDLQKAVEQQYAESELGRAEGVLSSLTYELEDARNLGRCMVVVKKFSLAVDLLSKLAAHDDVAKRRDGLSSKYSEMLAKAQAKAIEMTKI